MRLALATYRGARRLVEDDRLLQRALESRGLAAEPAVWDDAAVEWARFDGVVVRSCWDYHLRLDEFDTWIGRLQRDGVPLWNPPEVLRWNARKNYLAELEAAGVPVVPTRFIEDRETRLEDVLDETGWDEVVIKPLVSASAHGTWRTSRAAQPVDLARYESLLDTGGLMVQPFLREIQTAGEWSLCFFDQRFSHAVIKRPTAGDFRVQSDHGGSVTTERPTESCVAQAEAALAAAGRRTVYARVDGCIVESTFLLMELELLEPGLFLSTDPEAPARFADAVIGAAGQE